MVMNQNNVVTVTTIAAFVGTTLKPVSPLRPQLNLCNMRHRRLPASPTADSTWQRSLSKRICDESRSNKNRLFDSQFDDYDNEIDTRKTDIADKKITITTNLERIRSVRSISKVCDNISTDGTTFTEDDIDMNFKIGNSTMTKMAVLDEVDDEKRQRDMYFAVNRTVLEDSIDIFEKEGQLFDIASKKLTQFSKEETPPMSIILLNIVAIIWGSQHAIIKTVVDDSDPAAFTFLRFGLASLIAAPYLPGVQEKVFQTTQKITTFATKDGNNDEMKNEIDLWKPWRWGIEMGLWMFLGFSLQAIGLQTTTAQRSGFLLYLNVKFVPFFAKVLLDREISRWTWVSAFVAFSGTALLALDGQSFGLNIGDIWSVMAAAASAMFILRLEKASSEVPKASELNATSLLVVAVLSGAWLLMGNSSEQIALEITETAFAHPLELLYLGSISTALANFIQAKAQKDVPAERASIIYSLDPVYGAFFSWIILGETLGGPQSYFGASIIFVAAVTNSLLEFSKTEETKA